MKVSDERLADPEWLREKRVEEGMTYRAIGEIVGVNESTVRYHCKKHGIGNPKKREVPIEALKTFAENNGKSKDIPKKVSEEKPRLSRRERRRLRKSRRR